MSGPRDEVVIGMAELLRAGEPFALATVVRTVAAVAAKPGAKALIRADGSITGWIGGGCTRSAVEEAARRTLRDGRARLIRIQPRGDGEPAADDLEVHLSSCPSGGTVDVFVEPMLPPPRLIIMGGSPAGRALSDLARRIGFAVTVAAPAADQAGFAEVERRIEGFDLSAEPAAASFVVVATQGRGDRAALREALLFASPYVALIASRRKAAALKSRLLEDGLGPEAVARLRAPAGLDLGAITPEEIALAILADIVRERRRGARVAVGRDRPARRKVLAPASPDEP
ncbi:MAG TPA: XdhC/CoxI family protein [Geminicoccaceae bacterium]|nr:XdhC/CoxI family protein [Geminicoccaceae bacterium]